MLSGGGPFASWDVNIWLKIEIKASNLGHLNVIKLMIEPTNHSMHSIQNIFKFKTSKI